MCTHLEDLLTYLDALKSRASLPDLLRRLSELELNVHEMRKLVELEFSPVSYQRHLVREGTWYQALALCWAPGQASPIHDHAGSSCGVRVLQGVATETIYRPAPQGVLRHVTRWMPRRVFGGEDLDIHTVGNHARDEGGLITLHVYSPPLRRMGKYELIGHRLVPLTRKSC